MTSITDTVATDGDGGRDDDLVGAGHPLIAGLIAGDEVAFEALLRQHGAHMMAVARRFMRSEQDAADAMQDALVNVFRKADQFAGGSKLSTWLHRVTVNACLMRLRSESRRHEVNVDELAPAFDSTGHHVRRPPAVDRGEPAGAAMTAELREMVRECIDRLPEAYREVILLRDIEELDTEETARVLGETANCVKTRLHRARCALRELLLPVMCEG